MKLIVYKKNETLDVLLLKHKGTDTYSYVNVTKGHICSCIFDSMYDGLLDIVHKKNAGEIEDFEIVKLHDCDWW